jgi:hypothetical protein
MYIALHVFVCKSLYNSFAKEQLAVTLNGRNRPFFWDKAPVMGWTRTYGAATFYFTGEIVTLVEFTLPLYAVF